MLQQKIYKLKQKIRLHKISSRHVESLSMFVCVDEEKEKRKKKIKFFN